MFDFGSNWEAFSEKRASLQRLAEIRKSLQSLLSQEMIKGRSFLDLGCGSGLFSIAAYQLGAARVVGIDIDPRCIAVCQKNLFRFAPHAPILFRQMSVLDSEALKSLGEFDIVYAWGSVHHTGAMWTAIRNASRQLPPGGTLVLAIYNKHFTSPLWRVIKRRYNQLPTLGQRLMTVLFAGVIYAAKFLTTRRNPLIKERGMDFWHDVVDWMGGYPYEFATPKEVQDFVVAQGFRLDHYVPAGVPTGCNEFVFVRNGSKDLHQDARQSCEP